MSKILMNFSDYTHTLDRKVLNTYGGVGYYRIVKPSQNIEGNDIKVIGKEILHFGDTLEEQFDNLFQEYDVYWTSYFADDKAGAAIFYHAQKYGKKVIIDVDDNYLDVPESNLLYERFKPGKRERAMCSTILSFADALTVSTEPLKQRLYDHIKETHGIEKKIYVIPNMNDARDWQHKPAKKHKDKMVIGYTGSNSHQDDLMMVMPAIKELLEKYPNLHFETIGVIDKTKVPLYFKGMSKKAMDRCAILPATSTFNDYPAWLAEQKWDIGIAPLVDTPFTRSKSHIKYLEYSIYGIPTVASRVYPYFMELEGREVITDGETGLLAKPHEWKDKLEKLITDRQLRERLGKAAKQHVLANWQYDKKMISDSVNKMLDEISG